MSSPNSSVSTSSLRSSTWQDKLQEHCRRTQLHPPVFNIVSDRRGGRTAWSSTVTISGHHIIAARFWYDGQFVNNAKEDAAEVALQQLTGGSVPPMPMGGMRDMGMGAVGQGRGGWAGRMTA